MTIDGPGSSPDDSEPPIEGSAAEAPAPAGSPLTRAGAAWVATALVLVLLTVIIVFILQNQTSVELTILGLDVDLPLGVAMLIAAVLGGVLVGLTGGVRVVQLRREARQTRRRLRS